MKRHHYTAALILTCAAIFCSCSDRHVSTASYAEYPTECIANQTDGHIVLRVWVKGKDKKSLYEEARRKAVSEVLFNGLIHGDESCNFRPLVTDRMAKQQHKTYFDALLSDNGGYGQYAAVVKRQKGKDKILKNDYYLMMEVMLVVDREGLKDRLINDNIIKQTR